MDKSLRNSEWYKEHQKWLKDSSDGKRALSFNADLRGADLCDADLRGAYLRGAYLRGAYLCGADLRGADLRGAYLRGAYLYGADLRGADLHDAYLCDADLCGADLCGAYLRDADLRGADLCDADLRDADLRGVDLHGVDFNYLTIGIHPAPQGELIVWGKKSNHIVKMLVKAEWKRSCATTRKFRSEAVLVLEIDDGEIDRIEHLNAYGSMEETIYEVGKITISDLWDDNRWNECSHGIHWFLTRQEAEKFSM